MHFSRAVSVVFVVNLALLSVVPAVDAATSPTRPDAQRAHGSSDAQPGPLLATPPAPRSAASPPSFPIAPVEATSWTVAPGLTYDEWVQAELQGPTTVHLLTAKLDQPGLSLDQVSGADAQTVGPLTSLLAADHDVAGINADFFDIADTGAALGVAVDRERGLLHAPASGWNLSFVLDRGGDARIEQLPLAGTVTRGGQRIATVAGLNTPHVRADQVVAYTAAWGRADVAGVVDGARQVRVVHLTQGIVRSNRYGVTSTPATPVTGTLLVGRRDGAAALRALRVGQRVQVTRHLTDPGVKVAVSGSAQLLRDGRLATDDNVELHPRTAIGIDADHHQLHLLVVDGRSESSSGATLVQVADLLSTLGDENALNLDGGGSSTLVAPDANGVQGVRNTPSDGHERPIPEGLALRYTQP